jgi:hypothetical protein
VLETSGRNDDPGADLLSVEPDSRDATILEQKPPRPSARAYLDAERLERREQRSDEDATSYGAPEDDAIARRLLKVGVLAASGALGTRLNPSRHL